MGRSHVIGSSGVVFGIPEKLSSGATSWIGICVVCWLFASVVFEAIIWLGYDAASAPAGGHNYLAEQFVYRYYHPKG